VSPIAPAGTYNVVVNGSTGSSLTSAADQFTFVTPTSPTPAPAPPAPPAPPKPAGSCQVPNLLGHTLPYVRVLLRKGNCTLGAVVRRGRGAAVVANQSPRPGRTLAARGSVGVTLTSRGRA
jgi:hypothetical protein